MNSPLPPIFTEKEIFEVVKYFKDIYTTINLKEEIYLVGRDFYYSSDPYFLIYGTLAEDDSNVFVKWLNDKRTTISISEINKLRECLKKNVVSMEFDDKEFKISYKDKENIKQYFLCENKENKKLESTVQKIKNIQSALITKAELDENLFNRDIFEVYIDDRGNLVETYTENKLIEIPVKKIVSNQKGADSKYVRFGPKDNLGKRYVELSSLSNKIELHQLYATI